MKVTRRGQVTIPLEVRNIMDIHPGKTEIEFVLDEFGCCYLKKIPGPKPDPGRFRKAHLAAKLRMGTEEIVALTRT